MNVKIYHICQNKNPFDYAKPQSFCHFAEVWKHVLKENFHNKVQKSEGEEVDAKLGVVVYFILKASLTPVVAKCIGRSK